MPHLNIEQFNQAGYPLLWVLTQEPSRVIQECSSGNKIHWDFSRGISADLVQYEEVDPVGLLEQLELPQETVVFLENYHHFLENTAVVQGVVNLIPRLKSNGTTLVVLAPIFKAPSELNAVLRVIEHGLPDWASLLECLNVFEDAVVDLDDQEKTRIVKAGSGMTLAGFEDAVALSLVQNGQICPKAIWEEKADMMKKSGCAEIYKGTERFADIGGLEALKQFCLRSLTSGRKGARGVMLLGVPGTGKSMFAKALGNEVNRCTISLDLSRMFSSLVGETERNIRETLAIIDKLEPSVVFIDEIEKALSGVQSSGRTDGGTGARVFSTFLQWLNDHESDSYVVATCNSIEELPPEFLRQERWDGIFFVDQPGYEEREQIWELYKAKYEIEDRHPESVTGWTGAEIKSACRLAQLQEISLNQAVKITIPLTVSAGAKIEKIRKNASGRCLCANSGEIYRLDSGHKSRRINQAS